MALEFDIKISGSDSTKVALLRTVASNVNAALKIDPTEIASASDKFTAFRDATIDVSDEGEISVDVPNANGVFEDREDFVTLLRDELTSAAVQNVHFALYFLGDSHITDNTCAYKVEDSSTAGTYVATPLSKNWSAGSALA